VEFARKRKQSRHPEPPSHKISPRIEWCIHTHTSYSVEQKHRGHFTLSGSPEFQPLQSYVGRNPLPVDVSTGSNATNSAGGFFNAALRGVDGVCFGANLPFHVHPMPSTLLSPGGGKAQHCPRRRTPPAKLQRSFHWPMPPTVVFQTLSLHGLRNCTVPRCDPYFRFLVAATQLFRHATTGRLGYC